MVVIANKIYCSCGTVEILKPKLKYGCTNCDSVAKIMLHKIPKSTDDEIVDELKKHFSTLEKTYG